MHSKYFLSAYNTELNTTHARQININSTQTHYIKNLTHTNGKTTVLFTIIMFFFLDYKVIFEMICHLGMQFNKRIMINQLTYDIFNI